MTPMRAKDHRPVVFSSLRDAMHSGLNLLHLVFGQRDLFRQPGDGLLERPQFLAVW
jgi:hypothetical protein